MADKPTITKGDLRTKIIEEDDLSGIVTVPQCVDNQFVTEKLFKRMVKEKRPLLEILNQAIREQSDDPSVPHKDPDARELWESQKAEYNRALLFSRKVVINRAAFWNTPVLIAASIGSERDEFSELLWNGTIIPFLLSEKKFDEVPKDFSVIYGEKAIQSIAEFLAGLGNVRKEQKFDVTCVRFRKDDDENEDRLTIFFKRFREELQSPISAGNKRDYFLERLAKTLLSTEDQQEIDNFKPILFGVVKEINQWLVGGKGVNREDLYKTWICQPDTLPAVGQYRDDGYTFALKKWFDALYCANLPSSIGALTFVPRDFPTAFDLGVSWQLGQNKKQVGGSRDVFDEVLGRAKNDESQRLWKSFQEQSELVIPSPHELTHKDILEIRSWNIWDEMLTKLDLYIDGSISADEMLGVYRYFNEVLGQWWLNKDKGRREDTAERFSVAVGRVYQLGKFMFGLLRTLAGDIPILPREGTDIPDLDKDNTRWGVEVGLFVIGKWGIDWRRTQLIQRMKNEMKVSSDEVRKSVHELIRIFPELAEKLPKIKPSDFAEAEG